MKKSERCDRGKNIKREKIVKKGEKKSAKGKGEKEEKGEKWRKTELKKN